MTPEAKKALEESIDIWERKKKDPCGSNYGARSCPLCTLFNTLDMKYTTRCNRCPIFEYTHSRYCEWTPYDAIQECLNTGQRITIEMIDNEINFLKEVLSKA